MLERGDEGRGCEEARQNNRVKVLGFGEGGKGLYEGNGGTSWAGFCTRSESIDVRSAPNGRRAVSVP